MTLGLGAVALTPQREAFCQFMVTEKSAADAYRKAFPRSVNWSSNTVYVRASELLKDSKVQVRLAELREVAAKQVQERTVVTVARVVEGIASIATNPDARDADRLKAWELLGRHLAMFTDRVQIDHTYLQSYIRGKLSEVGVDVEAEDAVNEAMRLLGAK